MNLLDNASFETSAAWTPSALGAFVPFPATEALDGDAVGLLIGGTTPGGDSYLGSLTQTVVRPSGVYHAAVWCRQLTPAAPSVVLSVVEGGAVREVARLEPDAVDAWHRLAATFVAEGTISAFVVAVDASLAGDRDGQWYVDAAEFSEVTVGSMRSAYLALLERLGQINGSGYYHSLDGKQVIPRWILPGDPGAPPPPYICCVVEDDAPYEQVDSDCIRTGVRVAVYAWLPERADRTPDNTTAADAMDWYEDLHRCLMPGDRSDPWTLGDAALESIDLVAKSARVFAIDGLPPHVRVLVQLNFSFSRADLGPDA